MINISWSKDWTVDVRVRVERRGHLVFGEIQAELLEAIGRHHSITAAAKSIGMSYRRAWTLIQEINSTAGAPVVEAAVGGLQGGGARLTERGRAALDVYRELQAAIQGNAGSELRRLVVPGHEHIESAYVHVVAAISLQEALGQVLSAFALHRPAIRVRAVYGSSNELAEHLLSGAPGDLFISADPAQIDRLESESTIVPGTRRTIAFNSLAVIGGRNSAPAANVGGLATNAVKRIALADRACPLGRISHQYLESVGSFDKLRSKLFYVDSSRAVLSAVASGTAGAGLAFLNDAERSGDYEVLFRIPRAKAATSYVAAVIAAGDRRDESQELLELNVTRSRAQLPPVRIATRPT